MNIPTEKLFEKHISINPFGDPEKDNFYDYELGLNIPCRFRVNNRCEIYEARPLNCRLFPYWVLANAPKKDIPKIIDATHKCIVGFEPDDEKRKKYKAFLGKLSGILLKESKATEDFMKNNNFKDSIQILVKNADEEQKIKMCIGLLDKNKYKNFIPLAKNEIKQGKFASLEEIKNIQLILD